jgi:hypothetical protein
MHSGFELDYVKGRDHLEEICGDGRIILKWILNFV